jgi:predicted ester cyclase
MMLQQAAQRATVNLTRSRMDRVVDEHFRFEGRDDVQGVLDTLAHDVHHDVVGSPTGPLRGKAQARSFYEKIFADLAQQSVVSQRRYYGEDFVVDESLWRGTAVGNPLGFAGRNRPLAFRILHIFEFDGHGAIRRENVWMDTAAIAHQLRDDTPSSHAAAPAPAQAMPTRLNARDVVMSLYAAFDQGSLRSFGAVGSDFEAKVFGATVLDWPGFVQFGQAFVDAFPNGRHVFDHVVAEGDTVSTIGRYQGRHEGTLMGVAATGKEVDFVVMHVDRVRDGRIVEHRGIGDINTMWAQIGVAPPGAS